MWRENTVSIFQTSPVLYIYKLYIYISSAYYMYSFTRYNHLPYIALFCPCYLTIYFISHYHSFTMYNR